MEGHFQGLESAIRARGVPSSSNSWKHKMWRQSTLKFDLDGNAKGLFWVVERPENARSYIKSSMHTTDISCTLSRENPRHRCGPNRNYVDITSCVAQ